MKHTLPSLIMAVATLATSANSFAQTSQPASPAGQELLAQAAARLDQQPALSAKIRQRVRMFGEELVGSGVYMQLGDAPDKMLRLELKLQLAGQVSSLQQVSDGDRLWTRREVLQTKSLSFVDLERVRRELAAHRASRPPDYAADWLILGGLPSLLDGLEESFQFGPARPARYNNLSVWVIEGTWKPAALARFGAAGQGTEGEPSLPPEAPEQVQVVLGADDLFPYQIEFRRRTPADKAGQGSVWSPMLTMELFEVQFGAALDPLQFQYKAGDQEVADHTEVYLRKFGLTARAVAERAGERQ
jgi:hypothetical protein